MQCLIIVFSVCNSYTLSKKRGGGQKIENALPTKMPSIPFFLFLFIFSHKTSILRFPHGFYYSKWQMSVFRSKYSKYLKNDYMYSYIFHGTVICNTYFQTLLLPCLCPASELGVLHCRIGNIYLLQYLAITED